MGDGMFGHLAKGIVLSKIDDLVNQGADKRAGFLAELKKASNATAYCQLLRGQANITAAEERYLNEKWYMPGGWWPDPDATFHVVHQGLVRALELAAEHNLPLDSYWLPAAPIGVIEVLICMSPVQVTRIILTPSTSEGPSVERPILRDMWVIKRQTESEPPPLDPKADEVIAFHAPTNQTIVTSRMRDIKDTEKYTMEWRKSNIGATKEVKGS